MKNSTSAREYTAPTPLTPEQKITRANRLAQEAREAKQGTLKRLLIVLLLVVFGVIALYSGKKQDTFEKINLSGTKNVGYATDEINGSSGTRLTEKACEEFYETVGVPLYFYTEKSFDGEDEVAYAAELYDVLFSD